jgi:hypothetical protein
MSQPHQAGVKSRSPLVIHITLSKRFRTSCHLPHCAASAPKIDPALDFATLNGIVTPVAAHEYPDCYSPFPHSFRSLRPSIYPVL